MPFLALVIAVYFLAIAVRAQQYVSNRMPAGCIELLTETVEWFRYLLTLATSALGQLLLALLHSQGGLCTKVMTAFLNEGKLMGYSVYYAFACMLSVLVVDSSWSMLSNLYKFGGLGVQTNYEGDELSKLTTGPQSLAYHGGAITSAAGAAGETVVASQVIESISHPQPWRWCFNQWSSRCIREKYLNILNIRSGNLT